MGHLLCARPESGVSVEGVPGVSSSKGDESPGARGTGGRLSVGVEWGGAAHKGFLGNSAGQREIGQVEARVQKRHCVCKDRDEKGMDSAATP